MWDRMIHYFETLEQRPLERLIILVGGLLIFWIIEGSIPLIQLQYKKNKVRHAVVNFSFTLMHLIIHTLLAVLIILLSDWCKAERVGVVYWTAVGSLGSLLISFFILDFFVGWLVHFTQHKTPVLWRFHTIHHSDNNVDVTTGLRHHPVESLFRGLFFFLAILISGAPVFAVLFYQTAVILFTAFSHANISLPSKLDTIISWIFVSPNMHKVHHHWQQPYTDSNYGAILSIWDRMFGTFEKLPPSQIKYGLDRYYPNEHDENFLMLLKNPFRKQDG